MNTDFASNYVMAKARALWGKRLTNDNYQDMLSCRSVEELAEYLKGIPGYAEIFEGIPVENLHRQQLEALLKNGLYKKYMTVCHFHKEIGNSFYKFYIYKNDVDELIKIVALLSSDSMDKYIFSMPVYNDETSLLNLYDIANVRTPQELITATEKTPYCDTLKKIYALNPLGNHILTAEVEFKKFLGDELEIILKKYRNKDGAADLRSFFATDCDIYFLNSVYRMQRFSAMPKSYVIPVSLYKQTNITKKQRLALFAAVDENEFLDTLRKTKYEKLADDTAHLDSLARASDIYKYNIFKKKLRYSTDPCVIMYSYLMLAQYEISNIIHIIEGIRYSLPTEKIRELLLMADCK